MWRSFVAQVGNDATLKHVPSVSSGTRVGEILKTAYPGRLVSHFRDRLGVANYCIAPTPVIIQRVT